MTYSRLTILTVVLALLLFPAFTSRSLAASQDDIMERIRLLEIQIQQLKDLKEQQKLAVDKEQQCLKPIGHAKFCKCIAETLPREVSFEQYVHFLVTTREGLKYDTMTPETRQAVDASLAAREKCVDKGWFK
jgi:hypothetical protein